MIKIITRTIKATAAAVELPVCHAGLKTMLRTPSAAQAPPTIFKRVPIESPLPFCGFENLSPANSQTGAPSLIFFYRSDIVGSKVFL
jgi:hypothetical protein